MRNTVQKRFSSLGTRIDLRDGFAGRLSSRAASAAGLVPQTDVCGTALKAIGWWAGFILALIAMAMLLAAIVRAAVLIVIWQCLSPVISPSRRRRHP